MDPLCKARSDAACSSAKNPKQLFAFIRRIPGLRRASENSKSKHETEIEKFET